MKQTLALLALVLVAVAAQAGSPASDIIYPTMGEAIDASGFEPSALVSIEQISEKDGVGEYLIRQAESDLQANVLVVASGDFLPPKAEEYHFSHSDDATKSYPGGDISYEDCEWGVFYSALRPSFAIATCPYGKILAGWECYWDSNSTENENIRVYPNRIECRYRDNGSRAYARAYCCHVAVSTN
jgi:hypothetical protein